MSRLPILLLLLLPLAGCGFISGVFEGGGAQGAPPPQMQPAGHEQPTMVAEGAATSTTTTTTSAQTSSAAPAAAAAGCLGDFTLGRQAMIDSSAGLGHDCNAGRSNCRDGYFIEHDGACYCVLSCSSLVDDRDGASCTGDGSWTCQHVQASNAGGNHARICAAQSWNLCQHGG